MFSLEDYCSQFTVQQEGKEEDPSWSHLHETSKQFLKALDLPSIHPFCNVGNNKEQQPFPPDGIPNMGPMLEHDYHKSILDSIVTHCIQAFPALYAMSELWLRLFASAIAPLCITYLLWDESSLSFVSSTISSNSNSMSSSQQQQQQQEKKENTNKSNNKLIISSCIFSVASSIVLMTDTYYVLHFGEQYGTTLLFISIFLSIRATYRHKLNKTFICIIFLMVVSFFGLLFDYDNLKIKSLSTSIDIPHTINEGLYYNSNNTLVNRIVSFWPESKRTYSIKTGATPWLPTGDARTGIPFLVNFWNDPKFTRVFLKTKDDGEEYDEVLALDIAFPTTGHDQMKPLYLILHGLSGGSQEEYIQDLVHRRTAEGHTVVIMIARGLMDLPIRGWDVFHGARIDDVDITANTLRRALAPDQLLVGAGYSMGGIIISNYVARSSTDCALDAAIAVSGGLDMRHSLYFGRALRLWQPLLVSELRNTFILGKMGEKYRQRLTKEQMLDLMRAYHIKDVDTQAVVAYNGFDDIHHYYSEMSAMGDRPFEVDGDNAYVGRIANVSIPLCVMHALDDPLIPWRTVAAKKGLMHPTNLIQTGSGNLILLLTKGGGHVGWPSGWLPSLSKWRWMSDAVGGFVNAVNEAKATTT